MLQKIIYTDDGSPTIEIPSLNVTYHSRRGAIQESMHVYIDAGLKHVAAKNPSPEEIHVFEMGFGTGLNALLTLVEAERLQKKIVYTTVELYPLEKHITVDLNYNERALDFQKLHTCDWEIENAITPCFFLRKLNTSLHNFSSPPAFHVIFFDAFAPAAQPDLWTEGVFRNIRELLLPGGILVTYCSKGDVQRAMKAAGFVVEKLPGPVGKREMVRGRS